MGAVRQSIEQGRHLLLEAPSGIGKTIGALQPAMLDALSQNRRVFFLTAKNTQHAHPLATLRAQQSPRAVSFHGREKMCIHTVYACHEEHCPFLQMFAQKLEQTNILGRLQKKRVVDATDLITAGEQTRLCPFELALLVAETADAIVCDYNYVFDPQVHLRHLLQDDDTENTIVIIDEAHNLVDRARGYYSPMLSRRQVRELYPHLQFLEKTLARAFRQLLHRIEHCFDTLAMDGPDHEPRVLDDAAEEDAVTGTRVTELEFFERLKPELNRLAIRYLLDKTSSGRVIADDPVDAFLSQLGRLITVLGYRGDEFVRLFDPSHGGALRVVCLDASKQLAQRMNKFHAVIAMSATLGTLEFHQKMLGLDPHRTDRVRLPSPFPPENKVVRIVDNVLTTYRHRSRNYGKIARVIEATVDAHPGNYMALFPSYEFLDRVTDELATTSSLLIQRPQMSEHERANLLDALGQQGTHQLMLAVQGGIFAEGIDYPGELLSGVIVVSPALPQVTYERELMRRYYQNNYGRGFEFAYLYPGMNRVIQSVGRLIRTDSDRGVAVLVGRRFAEPQYQALFPHDWSQRPGDLRADDLAAELALFWRGTANATLAPPA